MMIAFVVLMAGCPNKNTPLAGPASLASLVAKLSAPASFTMGSPMPVTFTLENQGGSSITVAKPEITPNLVLFIVKDASGNELKFDGEQAKLRPFGAGDFTTLAAGGTVSHTFDLAESFHFPSTGRYTVSAVYRNDDDGRSAGVIAFTTPGINSNSITFQVQ